MNSREQILSAIAGNPHNRVIQTINTMATKVTRPQLVANNTLIELSI